MVPHLSEIGSVNILKMHYCLGEGKFTMFGPPALTPTTPGC